LVFNNLFVSQFIFKCRVVAFDNTDICRTMIFVFPFQQTYLPFDFLL
jgi:hypothetical protein